MNPYESPRSLAEASSDPKQSPASQWMAARAGIVRGGLLGAKWAAILFGSLCGLGSLAFAGLTAYRASQAANDSQHLMQMAAGLIGLVLFALVAAIVATFATAMLAAAIAGLWGAVTFSANGKLAEAEPQMEKDQ